MIAKRGMVHSRSNEVSLPTPQRQLLELAHELYGKPEVVLLAGSYARGCNHCTSDVDAIIILPRVARGRHETVARDGFVFDLHCHDLETLNYVLLAEQKTGPVEITKMVAEAIALPAATLASNHLQRLALHSLERGPRKIHLDKYRYEISLGINKLLKLKTKASRSALAIRLYQQISHAILQSEGRFIAVGRDLGNEMEQVAPEIFSRLNAAIAEVLVSNVDIALAAIAHEVLEKIGGTLTHGLSSEMPPSCRIPFKITTQKPS